ncbi:hypothetical protein A6R68_22948, partial [Neotoma lepida]
PYPKFLSTRALPLIKSRIICGWECERHSQPWQLAVCHYGRALCVGVLVHPQWVLTAAHYISLRSVLHPLYNMSLLKPRFLSPNTDNSYNLMLLQLSEPASITEAVRVLSLPTEEPELESLCWHLAEVASSQITVSARMLQCVDFYLMSSDACKTAYLQKVTEFMLCARHWEGGKDTCMGDSGGPLACDGVL